MVTGLVYFVTGKGKHANNGYHLESHTAKFGIAVYFLTSVILIVTFFILGHAQIY
jgi:hypothetical protein